MKRLLIVTLALALSLVGSWTAAADPAEVLVPEPTAPALTEAQLPDVVPDASSSDGLVLSEGESKDPSLGLEDENYGIPDPERSLRQNTSCTYTCSHPLMCPNIIDTPRARCINGCCVY